MWDIIPEENSKLYVQEATIIHDWLTKPRCVKICPLLLKFSCDLFDLMTWRDSIYILVNDCSVLEQLGGKEAVMRHLSHADPNVRYEALLSVQKLMVHNW